MNGPTPDTATPEEERVMFGALHMGWRHVLFANWPVDPDVVRPHLPDGLTLDTYDGRAWLSVVPFRNVDVRPPWFPAKGVPLPEINLRTYVTRDDRPGAYFFSLDAEGVVGVLGARVVHRLPYYYARASLRVEDGRVRFESRRRHPGARPARFAATYEPVGDEYTADRGSLAAFLTDRHRYYTDVRDGIRYATVSHDPWPLTDVDVTITENSLFEANGFDHPDTEPVHYYSPGVDTHASGSKRASRR